MTPSRLPSLFAALLLVASLGACEPKNAVCTPGGSCTPTAPCRTGTIACKSGGVRVCEETGTAADGTPCPGGQSCTKGKCGQSCVVESCVPSNPCHTGTTTCEGDSRTCTDTGENQPEWTRCGDGGSCSGGTCNTSSVCTDGASCTPSNPCHQGRCDQTRAVCNDTGLFQSNGTSCGLTSNCQNGACTPCPMCSGKCTDTASDSNHCGRCGVSCLGGACLAGKCQPLVLASGQDVPNTIALDASNVYWMNFGKSALNGGLLMTVPRNAGAEPKALAKVLDPGGLAVTGGLAYYTSYSGKAIFQVSLSTAAKEIAKTAGNPSSLAVSGGWIYFGDEGTTTWTLTKVNTSGGQPTVVFANQSDVRSLTVLGSTLVWANRLSNAVLSGSTGGGLVRTLASVAKPSGVVMDSNNAYVAGSGQIVRVPLYVGSAVTLVPGLKSPQSLALDGRWLYWSDHGTGAGDGSLMRIDIKDGGPTTLASNLTRPAQIAVGGDAVYWTDSGAGTVQKLALPASDGTR